MDPGNARHRRRRRGEGSGRLVYAGAPLPLTLIAGLALGGCSAARISSSATLSGFVARTRPICASEAAKLRYIRSRAALVGRGGVLRREAAAGQAATAALERLPRPARGENEIARWLDARTVAATVAIDLAEAPAQGASRAAADVARELARARAQASMRARSLGVGACDGEL